MRKTIQLISAIVIIISYNFSNQLFSQNITHNNDTIVHIEQQPDFPGGSKVMLDFLHKNLHYPRIDKKNGIEGTVTVGFVVEKDGSITNVKILRSNLSTDCDEEAMRVIKLMPRWTPGKQDGNSVSVQFYIPLKFTLTNENIKKRK
ncbi:MAG: energy transducer TonB [Bacteroidetes bacterium]|nr:energy transducer TonB [Bacteroidota bacterium]